MRLLVVGIVLAMLATHALADSTTAKAAFEQGEKLTLQNKWADACPFFEASFRADPQLGALLALAECHEQIGRIASAWSELTDALVIAKERRDQRSKDIEAAIAELAPRVAKLKLTPPSRIIPGLTVRRGNQDITLLVGTDIPTDAGEHEIIAEAPDHEPWRQKVAVKDGATVAVEIPALAKATAKVAPTVSNEGTLKITTAPNAQIILDAEVVGTGTFEGKVKSGGHTLRIVAGGMRPYQSEILVSADQVRTIDVPLEPEGGGVVVMSKPEEDSPWVEIAGSLGAGFKNRNERPLLVTARIEIALRLGKRVNFGTFGEYGSIDTGNACGFDIPGPFPTTEFDFGPRNQFQKCWYFLTGTQLYVHILPKQRIDPYVGIAPAFRFGFAEWKSYVAGEEIDQHDNFFPAIVVGVRAGVNYHPTPQFKAWEVGGYVEGSITAFGEEANDTGGGDTFVSFLGGVRTSLQF